MFLAVVNRIPTTSKLHTSPQCPCRSIGTAHGGSPQPTGSDFIRNLYQAGRRIPSRRCRTSGESIDYRARPAPLASPKGQGNRKVMRDPGLAPCRRDCSRPCGTGWPNSLDGGALPEQVECHAPQQAQVAGAWPVCMRHSSSRKATSRTQCRQVAMPQCALAVTNRCRTLGGVTGDEVAGFDTDPASHPSFRLHQQEAAMNNGLPCRHRPHSGSGASRSTSTPTLQSGFQRLGSSRAHPTGDVVLRSMARQTQECLPPSPKQPGFGVDGGVPGLAAGCRTGSPWV